jgi:hypothetical protein
MIRIYLAIALLLALAGGGWYLHHRWFSDGYQAKAAEVAVQNAKAAQKAQTRTVAADAGAKAATDAGQVKIAANAQATHETVRVVHQYIHDHPSPVACVVQPDSLHALQRAASAANSAAGAVSGTRPR